MHLDQWFAIVFATASVGTLYFIPTIIGFHRGKRNRAAIFVLNLFFGWTFVGWVACLIWALTKDTPIQVNVYHQPPPPGGKP